jgi:hypothetical protein
MWGADASRETGPGRASQYVDVDERVASALNAIDDACGAVGRGPRPQARRELAQHGIGLEEPRVRTLVDEPCRGSVVAVVPPHQGEQRARVGEELL